MTTDHPYDDPSSQAARRHALENDRKLKEQGTTYSTFAEAFADELSQGRFRATGTPNVIGAAATPVYPAGPAWCAADQAIEPPINFQEVSTPEPVGTAKEIEESLKRLGATGDFPSGGPEGGAAAAPASGFASFPDVVKPAAPLPKTRRAATRRGNKR